MPDETVMRRVARLLRRGRDDAATGDDTVALPVDEEAERVVRRYALRCGAVGAIVSVPATTDFETDVLAIMAGDATKETLKRASVEWSHEFAWRSLQRAVAARAAQRVD